MVFDIPSQPLVSALNAYGAVTQVEVFYDGALAVGHRSTAVVGMFVPREALHRLLEGTDFIAEAIEPGTVTVRMPDTASIERLAAVRSGTASFEPYLALIQSTLRDALCRDALTRADANDLLVRFWIAPSGIVERTELLTSTGVGIRDSAYADALRNLDIGQPSPAGMPQPVTIMILPRNIRDAGCNASDRQAVVH